MNQVRSYHMPLSSRNLTQVPQLLRVSVSSSVSEGNNRPILWAFCRGSNEDKVLKTGPHKWQDFNNVGYFYRKTIATAYIIWGYRFIQTLQIFLKSNLTMCLKSLKSVSTICRRNFTFRNSLRKQRLTCIEILIALMFSIWTSNFQKIVHSHAVV